MRAAARWFATRRRAAFTVATLLVVSGAYKGSLAAVPTCIAECRSVRVDRVLDASRNLLVLVFVLAAQAAGTPAGRRLTRLAGDLYAIAARSARLTTC
jgi:hypothetical protein